MTQADRPCQDVADEALDAFWAVVVKHYPQAKSGDLSIDLTIRQQLLAEECIEEWVGNNVTIQDCDIVPGYRFKLFRDVERFSDFVAPAGLTGTVTDVYVTGVWAKMDQHIPGAEHWENHIFWETPEGFASDTEPA